MNKIIQLTSLTLLLLFASCEKDPENKTIPLNVDPLETDSDLYLLLERVSEEDPEYAINCIDFNYDFTLFVFESNGEFIEALNITDDRKFSDVLGALLPGQTISVNYPIQGTLDNGDILDINTNEELKTAIDSCYRLEQKGKCDNALVTCHWVVGDAAGPPNGFEGDNFTINENGVVQYHIADEVYFGTWISFFIGEELHLNMDFTANGPIAEQWNYDWKVVSLTLDSIELETATKNVVLKQDCAIDCSIGAFEVCEDSNTIGSATFDLEAYTVCLPLPANHDTVSPVVFSFYESEMDATNDINPVSSNAYQNIVNPQTIFSRIEYKESGEILVISNLVIEAINCN